MPTNPPDTNRPAGPSAAQPSDPQQETVRTRDGIAFVHAGSGNSLGDGRTAGGSANVAARDELQDADEPMDGQTDDDEIPGSTGSAGGG